MNITEDYCSYEVYKLLKEKGFDGEIHTTFDEEGYTRPSITHQMAIKWLRTKGIYIYIQPTKYVGGALYGFQAIVEDGRNDDWKKSIHHEDNYEEAVEAALKYCLENLI